MAKSPRVEAGALPAEALKEPFPPIRLPLQPPYPPMEAASVVDIPSGPGWRYEPKWDGFRCLAFKAGDQVLLQSKSGQPLGRYFPEVVDALRAHPARRFVLDGELVVLREGRLSFDDLLQRIHPAESRVQKLSAATPATLVVFDLLVDAHGKTLVDRPLSERRKKLEALPASTSFLLSPASEDRAAAKRWMRNLAASGLDGVIAKRADAPYAPGERAMLKIKRARTADCVVGGFRWASAGGEVGSLLLGLYDAEGKLHHVGFTSSFNDRDRRALKDVVVPLREPPGFTGQAPGGPSRWSTKRSTAWEPLRPSLVCEVQYDHFTGGRFRHGTGFLRWRPDKSPMACGYEQLKPSGSRAALKRLLRA